MSRFLILTMFFFALTSSSQAQYDAFLNYSGHFKNHAAINQPSNLGRGDEQLYVSIPYINAYVGNSSLDFRTLSSNLDNDELDPDIYQRSLGQLDKNQRHLIGFGATVQPLFLAYKIRRAGEESFTFSLGFREKIAGNVVFSENLYRLARRGNKQFEGEKIDLDPLGMNLLYSREFTAGIAKPFYTEWGDRNITFRPGIRLKYIRGFVSVYSEEVSVSMHTHEGGRAIDMDMTYLLHSALPEPGEDEAFSDILLQEMNPLSTTTRGNGYGIDLGLTTEFGKRYNFSVGMTDIGSIHFTEQTSNYSHEGEHTYEGGDINFNRLIRGREGWYQEDFSEDFLNYEETHESYRMPLGARLVVEGGMHLFERSNGDDGSYTLSNIYLTYVQGFDDHLAATRRPMISLAYMHDFYTRFNLGASYGYGGYNRHMIGAYGSVDLGIVRIGLGSNNVNGLILPEYASGADLSLVVGGGF